MFDFDKIIIEVEDNAVDLTAGEVSLLVGADADTVTWGNITGDYTQQADLMLALDSKVDIDSPEFTGTPRTPTPPAGNISTRIANTKFVTEAIDVIVPPGGFGTLASKNSVDYQSEVTNKPSFGLLASKNKADYDTDLINKPTLGTLASKNAVDYRTDMEPTLGSLASKNAVDYQFEVTNKPRLGSLASKDSVNYETEVINKPSLDSFTPKDIIATVKSSDTGPVQAGDYFIFNNHLFRAVYSNNQGQKPTDVSLVVTLADEVERFGDKYDNYKVGDYIQRESKLYRFIYDHYAAEWDTFDVTEINYSKELNTGEKTIVLSDSNSSSSVDAEMRKAGAHAITKVHLNYATPGSTTVSETVKTIVISGHKRITVRATDGNKITFNGLYGSTYHLENKFYSIIVEDGAILELEGNISVTHSDSNGILVRRGGMVIYRSINGSVLNISLPSENYHDGILVESGGKFIAEGNIVATRGSTVYQQYPSHVINVSYGAEAHVKGITATNFNYCIGCTGGLASYDSISGAGVFTASGGRVFTGAQE